MENCIVQVVIPVYNSEKTLNRCLDSLLCQTFSAWQAILLDDASTDHSVEVIEKYMAADARFVLVKLDKNQGVSRVRNRALQMLTAPYTAFLDSDDYWEKDMLEVMYGRAQQYDCDVVQCRYIYDFENGKQVLPGGAFRKETYLTGAGLRRVYRRMMTGINMNHVCMKLIRTELIGDLRFDTTLKTAEDLVFCIHLFEKVRNYLFVPLPLYHYCRSKTSLTGNALARKQKFAANQYAAKVLLDALPTWGMDRFYYRILVRLRTYLIAVSKFFRVLRENAAAGGDENHG